MSNKIIIKKVKTEQDKKGAERLILEAGFEPRNANCKQCNKEPRQDGSSRCKTCANLYKEQKFNNARLQRKIENQRSAENIQTNKKHEQNNENKSQDKKG